MSDTPQKDDWSLEGSSVLNAPLVPPTDEEVRIVRLQVAQYSHDPAEEQMFLKMLGLAA